MYTGGGVLWHRDLAADPAWPEMAGAGVYAHPPCPRSATPQPRTQTSRCVQLRKLHGRSHQEPSYLCARGNLATTHKWGRGPAPGLPGPGRGPPRRWTGAVGGRVRCGCAAEELRSIVCKRTSRQHGGNHQTSPDHAASSPPHLPPMTHQSSPETQEQRQLAGIPGVWRDDDTSSGTAPRQACPHDR